MYMPQKIFNPPSQFSRLGTVCTTLVCFIRFGGGVLSPPFYVLLVCYSYKIVISLQYTAVSFGVVIEALLVFHRHTSTSDGMKTMFIWNSSYAFWYIRLLHQTL